MPDNTPRPAQEQPWENGWTPDTSRAPGTRRLWLAAALAVATVVACVTAIAGMDRNSDDVSGAPARGSSPSGDSTLPGLISFASPSASGATTPGKASASPSDGAGTTEPRPHASASASPVGTTKSPSPHDSSGSGSDSGSGSGSGSGSSDSEPHSSGESVRSVNYPDRYWHVSDRYVKLDPVHGSESREDSTFTLVEGLSNASCYSFVASDGSYLRHRNFLLRAERNDGSSLFRQDATFCARTSSYSDAVMLESVNYPGRYLRHKNFQLRLDPFQNSSLYRADSAFRLVDGLA